MRLVYLLFLSIIFSYPLSAEYIGSGQEPPGIRWKKIQTRHVEIIFPREIEQDAQHLANVLDYQYEAVNKTMRYKARPVKLLLTTQSVIANGFFAMAPRRTEWYGTPFPTGADDGDWYHFLASHEMRHVVQFDKILNRGFNMILGYVFGQDVPYILTFLTVPTWFWEGDAVLTETVLTSSGRGRDPSFDIGLRSLELADQRYSYYKAVLGSYKDYVSNHYPLGYLMVTHARRKYGDDVWAKVLGRTSFFTWYPFGFSLSTRGIMKKSVNALYKDSMNELNALWKEQQSALPITPASQLNEDQDLYTNYYFPQAAEDGSVIALKTGLADPQHLVRITADGREEKLLQTAVMNTFSVGGGKVAWDEYRSDPRWIKRSYSDVVIYDLKSGISKTITSKGKYLTPALSPDGSRVAAIEFTPQRQSSLVILDAHSGQELERLPNPNNEILRQPSWSEDGDRLVFTHQNAQGKALSVFDFNGRQLREIIPHCWQGIMHPVFYGRHILFNSYYSGIDNIFAVDQETGQPYQVTSRPLGGYYPAISSDGGHLYLSDYRVDGLQAMVMNLDTTQWIPIDALEDRTLAYFKPLIDEEQGGNIYDPDRIPQEHYTVEDYSPYRNALNFHSWEFYPDTLNPGFRLKSTDILNTTEFSAGLFFNTNEKTLGGNVQLSYAGFYPIIDLLYDRRSRLTDYKISEERTLRDTWTESSLALGFRLPLDFSRGIYRMEIQMAAYWQWIQIAGQQIPLRYELSNGSFMPVSYQLALAQVQRSVPRDMRPRSGQIINLIYRHTPLKGDYRASQLAVQGTFFFPGSFKHHALWLQANYERQQTDNYRYQAVYQFPRGYRYRYHDEFIKGSINYSLPLLYPDWSLGGLFYLKRVKANGFYDYGIGDLQQSHKMYRSAGFEVLLDHHWFTWFFSLEMGYRYSYAVDSKRSLSELLIQIPFF